MVGVGGAAGSAGAAAGGSNTGGSDAGGGAPGSGGMTGEAGASTGGEAGAGGGDPLPDCESNRIAECRGTNPIECHLGGTPGDYEVTLDLGGPTAGDTYVDAEAARRVVGRTTTAAGQVQRVSFFVNVRQPEGQPVQDVPAGTRGLDLYLRGAQPKLSAICVQAKRPAPKIWVAGDSTVCDQSGEAYGGWGQHLPQHFTAPVSIANYADSGESSGSFLGSARLWGAIKSGWTRGDWVLIQLGHNDKSTSASTFRSNLTTMVRDAKAAGVQAVLFTPIARVGGSLAQAHVNSVGANLPQIVRDLGRAEDVPVIDLTTISWNWLQTVTWTEYFANGTDRTHTNHRGAEVMAGLVRDAIRAQGLEIERYLR